MQRSISTLLTALLFSAAIVPNAMAQMDTPDPAGSSLRSTPGSEQQPANSAKPTSTQTSDVSQPSMHQMSLSVINTEKTRPGADATYPAYCPFLPARVKTGDWEYREALEKCLHGT